MSLSDVNNSCSAFISNNFKIQALDSTLHKSLDYFKDLLLDFQQLHTESENYKSQFMTQRELCERNNCNSAEALKNIIESKNKILQSLGSTLTRLNETKDFQLIDEAFKIISGDLSSNQDYVKNEQTTPHIHIEQVNKFNPDSYQDDSLNEIEGTPTGRTSPIIQSKKSRNSTVGKSFDNRDKLKCPNNWLTPEKKKIVKLTFPTPEYSKPGGRLRQARLKWGKKRQTSVVDLTCSPEFCGGLRSRNEIQGIQPHAKSETSENHISLPSPIIESGNFTFKATTKSNSPLKVSKSFLSLKTKKENINKLELVENTDNKTKINKTAMEDSINILNPLPKRFTGPVEVPIKIDPIDNDETHCEINSSMSLLEHVNELDCPLQTKQSSPTKRPLAENINITNTPIKKDDESSERCASKSNKISPVDNIKRHIPGLEGPMYKEPVARKKSEKRALRGWLCDECEHFFGELYKDNPAMMANKIEECSKHRGQQNPVRPRTPPNFWNPRWTVPDDTEELNRINNAI